MFSGSHFRDTTLRTFLFLSFENELRLGQLLLSNVVDLIGPIMRKTQRPLDLVRPMTLTLSSISVWYFYHVSDGSLERRLLVAFIVADGRQIGTQLAMWQQVVRLLTSCPGEV